MLVLSVACAALGHCIQLDDGSDLAPKTWGTAERVNPSGNAAEVAVDPAGNAVAVWINSTDFFSCRYTPAEGWGEVVWIGPLPEEGRATVAMDGNGTALAVWSFHWVNTNIWSTRSNADGEWGPRQQVDDNSGDASEPQISVGADGSAVAVWTQFDGQKRDVFSSRYSREGWDHPQPIEIDADDNAWRPQVVVDAQGNAVAVWEQFDDTRLDVWSNRYTSGSGWGSAERIETEDEGHARSPQVAADAQGDAVAVWEQFDGTRLDVWSNRYTSGSGWGVAERIETEEGGDASNAQVAMDAKGHAVAVWEQSDGTRYGIWSNRYTPSRGWGTAEAITPNDATDALEPRVAVDARGNAVSVWRQSGTTGDGIWSNRYTPSAGWGSAQRIDSNHPGGRSAPRVAVDANGNAIALWSVWGGGSSAEIWFNRLE
jgi:hypothetical protein